MFRQFVFAMAALLFWGARSVHGESPALVRDTTVVTVQTFQGVVPAKLTPVTPARDVSLVVLSDTLTAEDVTRIRRELPASCNTAFLAAHPLRIINVAGTGGDVSTPLVNAAQLQAALKRITAGSTGVPAPLSLLATLGGVPSSLPTNWAQTIIVGRLPAPTVDESWIAAWLGDLYRQRRARISFWSLDGAAPAWAQSVAGAAMGTIATANLNALLPMLNDSASFSEVSWDTKLAKGAWAYSAELKNAAGERVGSFVAFAIAPGYTPPLEPYLTARAGLRASPTNDEAAFHKVLDLNPVDPDALRGLATLLAGLHKPAESAAAWRLLTETNPLDGAAWSEMGSMFYAAESFDDAEQALNRAAELGINNGPTLETRARIHLRRNDYSGALPLIDEALAVKKDAQPLWLLRADCAHNLKRWPVETESLERAAALGPLPLVQNTNLISGYLAAGQIDRAIPHLRAVSEKMPPEAATRAQYAMFWEKAGQPDAAEPLWQSAIDADPKFEPAYLGLTQHYFAAHRPADVGKVADRGLSAIPTSFPLILAKVDALEASGDLYAARRLLGQRAPDSKNADLLKKRAGLEDWYGSGGSDAYASLLAALAVANAPQSEVVEVCRRALIVSLRDEHLDAAKLFADKLASAGDRSGLELLATGTTTVINRTEIPGGAEALHFLALGQGKSKTDRILLDFSHALVSMAPGSSADTPAKAEWQKFGGIVHEYFQRVSSLTALGERKKDGFEIPLSLADKHAKQRTEKVLDILGLKLRTGKEGITVKSAEDKGQAKKQETLAALAIDDQAIQESLAAGKTYILEIPVDSVPVFPAAELWHQAFNDHERFTGGLAETFVTDARLPRLYVALNSMDRAAAEALTKAVSLRTLAERYSTSLALYSAALALKGNAAEIPGGETATAVWQELAGNSPTNGIAFFESLLSKDDGRLIAFFYTMSQLDFDHQRFFTRSPQRAKRFYDLFRESSEMRRGGERRIGVSSFVEFLREVPLNEDLSVDFPGGPEVWMVAKGPSASTSSVAKMTRKMKRSAAPDDEDQILIRLATTEYKALNREQSELANFIAVTRIDRERTQPLTPDSALLLAQGFSAHAALFPYLAELGDLETADYQKLFSLGAKCEGIDAVTANMRLGQIHAFLAILGSLRESGIITPEVSQRLLRSGLDRFIAAGDGAAWTIASLSAVDDFAHAAAPDLHSRDAAIRALLIGNGPSRQKAFDGVLELQKVPSLDALFAIWTNLPKVATNPQALDEIQRQIATFTVLVPPKAWKYDGERRKLLEWYDTAQAQKVVARMREKIAKRKQNPGDMAKLSAELTVELEPWAELALVGRVYARYLDPSDLLVSEDPFLLRKHEFLDLGPRVAKVQWFAPSALMISSDREGSYFVGGLAEFSVAAGHARAAGNHIGGSGGEALATAVFASVRATDWRPLTPAGLASFGATVRLAREWIVESATSAPMHQELEQASRGILSLTRRKALLEAIDHRDWPAVWETVSVSDLHFLGDELLELAPKDLWNSPALGAMKLAATHASEPDLLGPVAPDLSGCARPRLRRYEPYEEYQRHALPDRMAQRLSELKLYLAWAADNSAWRIEALPQLAEAAADSMLSHVQMRDMWDWRAALEAYRNLKPEELTALVKHP